MTTFCLGELFAGPGGIALGARLASQEKHQIIHQWANDIDPDTYATNIVGDTGSGSVVCADIRTLNMDQLAALGDIDGLAFGFPCNDFSLVGEKKGLGGRYGPLYRYGVAALHRFQPQWFVAENVGGIRADGGATLRRIFADMADAGYILTPHYYHLEDYGVPQARHRIIVVGIREDLNVCFRVPSPKPFARLDVSAGTALANILQWARHQEATQQSQQVTERLTHIPPGGNTWHQGIPQHLRIRTQTQLSNIYRRLHPDNPAYTVTGSGGGGTHTYHWDEPRPLTNRERARLLSLPDDYVFTGSKSSVRKQIGMAVPPDGAKVIFRAILDSFAGVTYPSVPSNLGYLTESKYLNGDREITDLPDYTDGMLASVVQHVNETLCAHRDGELLCLECTRKVLPLALGSSVLGRGGSSPPSRTSSLYP